LNILGTRIEASVSSSRNPGVTKMIKGTCLIALKRKDRSPHTIDLEILEYLSWIPHILDLVVFIRRLQNEFPNAQAYNHTMQQS
jgi:hypothetical protein